MPHCCFYFEGLLLLPWFLDFTSSESEKWEKDYVDPRHLAIARQLPQKPYVVNVLSSSFSQNYSSQLFVTYPPYWPVLDGYMPRWVLWALFTSGLWIWNICNIPSKHSWIETLHFTVFPEASFSSLCSTCSELLSLLHTFSAKWWCVIASCISLVPCKPWCSRERKMWLYMTWMNVPMKVNAGSRVSLGLWRPYRKWVTTLLGLSFPWSSLWYLVFLRHHPLIVLFLSLLVYCSFTGGRLPG